jgi:tRNA pseudouridine38-40 synthase
MRSWVLGTNSNLPADISILWAQPVDETFHARFSAVQRHYRYVILNRFTRPALLANQVTWEHQPLKIERMQQAGDYLVGTHDFTSYRSVACQAKSPIRTVTRLTISRQENQVIMEISANGFLHHMVRNIAGVLMTIGGGEQPPTWARAVLEARDRTVGGITAPASGLYLWGIDYPAEYRLPGPHLRAMLLS